MDTQILLKVSSIADLQKLNEFLETTSIPYKIVSSNAPYGLTDHYYTYKPTQEFKDFCGGECLNRYGLISLTSAKELILQYAKRQGLHNATTILLDDTLKNILKTVDREISHEDVYQLIKGLFSK
jgi:hypothetical protein